MQTRKQFCFTPPKDDSTIRKGLILKLHLLSKITPWVFLFFLAGRWIKITMQTEELRFFLARLTNPQAAFMHVQGLAGGGLFQKWALSSFYPCISCSSSSLMSTSGTVTFCQKQSFSQLFKVSSVFKWTQSSCPDCLCSSADSSFLRLHFIKYLTAPKGLLVKCYLNILHLKMLVLNAVVDGKAFGSQAASVTLRRGPRSPRIRHHTGNCAITCLFPPWPKETERLILLACPPSPIQLLLGLLCFSLFNAFQLSTGWYK